MIGKTLYPSVFMQPLTGTEVNENIKISATCLTYHREW